MSREVAQRARLTSARVETLLEAATSEFASRGFEKASLQAIADAAGVSKAKIFYYFDDKEHLYATVLDRKLGVLLEPLESLVATGDAGIFWNSLQRGLSLVVDFSERDPRSALLVSGLYRRGGDSPSYQALLSRVRVGVARWLQEGIRIGAVRDDLPPLLLAEVVVGALVHGDRWLASQVQITSPEDLRLLMASFAQMAKDMLQFRSSKKGKGS